MQLFLFHSLTEDKAVKNLLAFRETGDEEAYYLVARELIAFAKTRCTSGNIIKEYILDKILKSENLPYIVQLRDFLRQDVKTIFYDLLNVDWDGLFREKNLLPLSEIVLASATENQDLGYVRSLEMMMECTSNEALVGAMLAHVESFS